MWEKPLYRLKDHKGKQIVVDVTSSAQPGLPHNDAINGFVDLLREKKPSALLILALDHSVTRFRCLRRDFKYAQLSLRSSIGGQLVIRLGRKPKNIQISQV